MLTYHEAQAIILHRVAPLGSEKVSLLEAAGRVLAVEVVAPWDLPAADNSAMDGYALLSAGCAAGTVLTLTDYIPAGTSSDRRVGPAEAARIMTGAPIPPGADAVVPLEEARQQGASIVLKARVSPGSHIRKKGEDVLAGERILSPGTILGPPQVSMLASCGLAQVAVHRPPRVAILSTGDELVELGTTPGRGEIIDSNAWALAAAVKLLGGEPWLVGTARDDRESHLRLIREGLHADCLITSAGVSAGDRDRVRETLREAGVEELFWKVRIRPGSPLAFGIKGSTPVFSLPGNPVAALITFEEFVAPALLKMRGERRVVKRTLPALLTADVRKKPGNLQFLRVQVTKGEGESFLATSAGSQQTGLVKTMLGCNALALLAADRDFFPKGESVPVHLLDNALQREEA